MTATQRLALRMVVQRFMREGRGPTEAAVRNALVFQGVSEAEATEQAGQLLAEAWEAVKSEVQS